MEKIGHEVQNSEEGIPYEAAAMAGEEMPEGLSLADQICYIGLRWLYASCRMKMISLETVRKERIGITKQCEHFRFRDTLSRHWADSIRRTEEARTAYRKNRTLENADRLLAAVEGR